MLIDGRDILAKRIEEAGCADGLDISAKRIE